MAISAARKRLDSIEVDLTPKEWAIRLADEMRESPTQVHFLRAVAKEKYRDWPWVKPFFKLAEQAEVRYPRNNPEDTRARNQLNRKLRTEFHALKGLIASVNETIPGKAETNGLKAALKLSTLHALIFKEAFSRLLGRLPHG